MNDTKKRICNQKRRPDWRQMNESWRHYKCSMALHGPHKLLKMFLMVFLTRTISRKNQKKILFFLVDHWLSARINRNWTSWVSERERETKAGVSYWRQRRKFSKSRTWNNMFDEVFSLWKVEKSSLKHQTALTAFFSFLSLLSLTTHFLCVRGACKSFRNRTRLLTSPKEIISHRRIYLLLE